MSEFEDVFRRIQARDQARETALREEVDAEGGLQAWGRTRFPELDWEGVDVEAGGLADRRSRWEAAAQQLRTRCAKCDGTCPWLGEQEACSKPVLQTDGTILRVVCPKRAAHLLNYQAERHMPKSGIPKRFLACSLANFDSGDPKQAAGLEAVRLFIEGFKEPDSPPWSSLDGIGKQGLALLGPVGTGKSHLATAALQELTRRGVAGRYSTVADLLAEFRAGIGAGNVEDVVRESRELPLIVLDDLGKEYLPGAGGGHESLAWAGAELFRLLDHRYSDLRPVIMTSNLPLDALSRRYGPAFASRLIDMCKIVTLDLPDYRRKRA
jgi:DNA replication protein DnaC